MLARRAPFCCLFGFLTRDGDHRDLHSVPNDALPIDRELLDALDHHASTYLHGHSVGGTNPSLLRAMGAGTAVIAFDVVFNREVLDEQGWYFRTPGEVAAAVDAAEADAAAVAAASASARRRAADAFSWDDVAATYEDLALRLAAGESIHPSARRAHRAETEWPG